MTTLAALTMTLWTIVPGAAFVTFAIGTFGKGRWAWRRHRWFWCVGFTWGLLFLMSNVLDRNWFGCAAGFVMAGMSARILIQRDRERQEVAA